MATDLCFGDANRRPAGVERAEPKQDQSLAAAAGWSADDATEVHTLHRIRVSVRYAGSV
jgi:hypothetical protein